MLITSFSLKRIKTAPSLLELSL